MTREADLSRTFVELADNLVQDFDIVDLLTTLADRCVDILDVTAAGIMLVSPDDHRELRIIASSDESMRVVEEFELQSGEGPCLDCYSEGQPVLNQHLDGTRWPTFEKAAIAAGFHTVHSLPLRLRGQIIGALNLFHTGHGVLDEADKIVGQALADTATITLLQQRIASAEHLLTNQLQEALRTRIIIEQAKGMLAERASLDVEDAFARMRSHARNNSRKLVEVASGVLDGSDFNDVVGL